MEKPFAKITAHGERYGVYFIDILYTSGNEWRYEFYSSYHYNKVLSFPRNKTNRWLQYAKENCNNSLKLIREKDYEKG